MNNAVFEKTVGNRQEKKLVSIRTKLSYYKVFY